MHITGYGLVALLGALGWWLAFRRGWTAIGAVFIAAAGLCLMGTAQGIHFFSGIQTGVDGIGVGVSQMFGH